MAVDPVARRPALGRRCGSASPQVAATGVGGGGAATIRKTNGARGGCRAR
jgi:hypothetical protein